MKIAICDDVKGEAAKLSELIQPFFDMVELFQYEEGQQLVAAHQKEQFDLIFLDIIMPALNGIEVAQVIREFDEKTPVVFVTNSDEFAVESYRVMAFDYLVKPISAQNLGNCLNRFNKEQNKNCFVEIEYMGVKTKILLDNIAYMESERRKVNFVLFGGKKITVAGKLDDFINLTEDQGFCRCHKSFMVNLAYVATVSSKDFTLITGDQVRISRAFLNTAKRMFFDYAFGGYLKR